MQSRTAAVVGGGVAVFVAVFAIAILTFSRCGPQLGAGPTARSSPVVASPSTGGQNSPQPSLSPFPEESPSPSPSPEPTPSPQPGQPLVFTDLALHPADVGQYYSPKQFGVTGGTPPYAWSITGGALPSGLSLSSGGTLSGTPQFAGAYNFTVGVSDSAGAGSAANLSLAVAPTLGANAYCSKSCIVEVLCQDVCGTFGATTGGSAPFQYSVVQGSLPPATALNQLALAGTFNTTGNFAFTAQVTDAAGAVVQVPALFSVVRHITLSAASLPSTSQTNNNYSARIPWQYGIGTPTVAVTGGTYPLANSPSVGPGYVLLSGPVRAKPGVYSFTLTLTDTSPCGPGYNCSSSQSYSITVTVR